MSPRSAIGAVRIVLGAVVLGAVVLEISLAPHAAFAQAGRIAFDHFQTRFPLTGAHERVACEACHVRGIFKGTPMQCAFCHTGSGAIAATGKPAGHIRSTDNCDGCHTTSRFEAVRRVDHDEVIGSCLSCHDGQAATGKPANHVQSGNDCGDCHSTLRFTAARFDHADVTGSCVSCHNGTNATGKPSNHVATSLDCGSCHSTRRWVPAGFDHTGVTGPCSSCHNGSSATGQPSGHFVTTAQCDLCHSTTAWTPVRFTHSSPNYPGDHRGNPTCIRCHTGNSQTVVWPFSAYQPDCAGCHANDYKPGEHHNRTVSEYRNCGASGCHRVDASSF